MATCKQYYTLFMICTIFQCNINLIISVAIIAVCHFQYCPALCTLEYSYKHTHNVVKGYILMIPLSLPMATSDCSTSYANAVGLWGNPWLNTCEDNNVTFHTVNYSYIELSSSWYTCGCILNCLNIIARCYNIVMLYCRRWKNFGLNVHGFNPIEVFAEMLSCFLGQKCWLFSIIKERRLYS